MTLNEREAENLQKIIREIRVKDGDPKTKKNEIKNLCLKASTILNKAARRKHMTLVFRPQDLEL